MAPRKSTILLALAATVTCEAFQPVQLRPGASYSKHGHPMGVALRSTGGDTSGPRPGTAGVYDTAARPPRVPRKREPRFKPPRVPRF